MNIFNKISGTDKFIYNLFTFYSNKYFGDDTMIVVKAKIKELTGECNVAGDFAEALDKKVTQLVKGACERAKGNNRRTVMAKDI